MDLLICNLSAGIMIMLTLVMRWFAKNKIPNGVFCLLWFMIGIRLLFPASFRTPLSILNVYFYRWNRAAPIKSLQEGTMHVDMMERLETAGAFAEEHKSIFLLIWLLGCAVIAAYFIRNYFQMWKEMSGAKPLENAGWLESCIAEQKIRRKVWLKSKEGMDSPMTWGILRPVIYFPLNFDREDKRLSRLVLLHECGHIRHFHSIFKLWNMVLLCAYWYNPMIWIMFFKFERDLEISADRYALRHTEGDVRKLYADYMIEVIQRMSQKHKRAQQSRKKIMYFHMFYHLSKGKSKKDEQERVEAIMNFKKMGACAIAATLLIPMGMTTVFATTNTVLSLEENRSIASDNPVINEIAVQEIVPENVPEAEFVSVVADWEEVKPFIIDKKERASYLQLVSYEYVTYGRIPPKQISLTTEFEGHTYKGTLDRTDYVYNDATDKYTGYYSGKIYRQD